MGKSPWLKKIVFAVLIAEISYVVLLNLALQLPPGTRSVFTLRMLRLMVRPDPNNGNLVLGLCQPQSIFCH